MARRRFNSRFAVNFIAAGLLVAAMPFAHGAPQGRAGAEVYRDDCARCHGPNGEGVADKHDEPLYGDRSVEALARLIRRTMPEDTEKKASAEDSAKVAAYIFDAFYSPAARARIQPSHVQLARLTVGQYQNAVADLIGSFRGGASVDEKRGLKAVYFDGREFKDDKKAFERIDPRIEFQFADSSPDTNKIAGTEFAIRWRGSVIAEETGDYEFALKTENGARLWVNDNNKTLIDAWVSSGMPREERATVRLLGGRAYPIRVDLFKFKEKSASITLQWKPPHKAWEPIPERNLTPERTAETMVITAAFPADDSSMGYERGTAVSKAWDQATTRAAIEVAGQIVENLDALSGSKNDAPDRKERVLSFCHRFVERAFRRPLTAEQKEIFVENQFAEAKDLESAVKRVVLLTLKSPRFLYPEFAPGHPDDYDIASRLSFSFWDTVPDKDLLAAANRGELRTPEQIAAQAERLLKHPRAKAKVRTFFQHWLKMEEAEDMSKDMRAFPGFDELVRADLRTSLDLFIEDVVWSERSDYRQLLLADYLFLNERLAKFYGVEEPADGGFAKVAFDARERAGVITHPFLLSTFAYYKNSSPIHRGVFLTRNIVGRTLKPPPMAIQFMDGRFDPSLTMREKVAELTKPANCQTCHSVINPLGFSLENFDAVGRFRTIDNQKPVDATSDYTAADGSTVRFTGPRDVAEYAAINPDAQRAFIQQLFHHIVKQPVAAYGANTLERLRESFAASDFHIQKLLVEIVKTSALYGIAPPATAKSSEPGANNKS